MTLSVTDANATTCLGLDTPAVLSGNNQTVAIGWSALQALANGMRNTIVGAAACLNLASSTNNSDNTALGYSIAPALVGGARNVFIGNEVAGLGGAINNNDHVFIGHRAGVNYSGTQSNNICLGSNVLGNNSDNNVMRLGDTTSDPIVRTFIGGIRNSTAITTNAVQINSSNQLGLLVSSKRFKRKY